MGVPFEKIDAAASRAQEAIAMLVELGAQSKDNALRAMPALRELRKQCDDADNLVFCTHYGRGL